MQTIIGVDAGGTKTAASIINCATQEIVYTKVCGAGNLAANPAAACENITAAVLCCARQCSPSKVIVGAAGTSGFNGAEVFSDTLRAKVGCDTLIVSDAMLGLYAAFHGGDGVLCIAGTGSIAYGKNGRVIARAGGWGHLLADEGGGVSVALQAIREALHRHDAKQSLPAYTEAILKQMGVQDITQAPFFVHNKAKSDIAALAAIIDTAAKAGDKIAADVLVSEGERLACTVLRLCGNLELCEPHIITMGSVLLNSKILSSAFMIKIQSALPCAVFEPTLTNFVPQLGAYYLWLEHG